MTTLITAAETRTDINNKNLELKTVLFKINLFCSSAVDAPGSDTVTTTATVFLLLSQGQSAVPC